MGRGREQNGLTHCGVCTDERDLISTCMPAPMHRYVRTVHDTEHLTFPRNSVVVPRRHPRIFRSGGCGFSVRAGADLPRRRTRISVLIWVENGRNQKANFARNNAEGSRNTSQGLFKLSL